jgi:hypothetical protein
MESPDEQQSVWVPIPPEFYGDPTENPETLIEDCEATFPRFFDDRMKTRVASRRLRGEAATWWPTNRICTSTWDSFKNLQRGEFNSEELIASLRSQLYGEKQQQHEDARNFIQYRRQIALRFNPAATEESIIQAVVQTQSIRQSKGPSSWILSRRSRKWPRAQGDYMTITTPCSNRRADFKEMLASGVIEASSSGIIVGLKSSSHREERRTSAF